MPEPECRMSERTSAVESAGGSFFFHRQGVARSRRPECRNAGMPECRGRNAGGQREVRRPSRQEVVFFIGMGLPEAGGREAGAGVPEVRESVGR